MELVIENVPVASNNPVEVLDQIAGGKDRRELQTEKVVTICDRLIFLLVIKKKGKIGWKALRVSLDCLVESFGRDTVHFSQIQIEDDLFTAKGEDALFERFGWNDWQLSLHDTIHSPTQSCGGRALANSRRSSFFSFFFDRRGRSFRLAFRFGANFLQRRSSALN